MGNNEPADLLRPATHGDDLSRRAVTAVDRGGFVVDQQELGNGVSRHGGRLAALGADQDEPTARRTGCCEIVVVIGASPAWVADRASPIAGEPARKPRREQLRIVGPDLVSRSDCALISASAAGEERHVVATGAIPASGASTCSSQSVHPAVRKARGGARDQSSSWPVATVRPSTAEAVIRWPRPARCVVA